MTVLAFAGEAPEQLELGWEPFVLAPPTFQWYIERRPSDHRIANWLKDLKLMQRNGWDLAVLLAPDSKSVVALGCRGQP